MTYEYMQKIIFESERRCPTPPSAEPNAAPLRSTMDTAQWLLLIKHVEMRALAASGFNLWPQ